MSNLCDAKKFYDTEFEAEIAAAKSSHVYEAELVAYKCWYGNHWHVGNVDPTLRSKFRLFNRTYCQPCNQHMKAKTYREHVNKARHLYLERKQKEAV